MPVVFYECAICEKRGEEVVTMREESLLLDPADVYDPAAEIAARVGWQMA